MTQEQVMSTRSAKILISIMLIGVAGFFFVAGVVFARKGLWSLAIGTFVFSGGFWFMEIILLGVKD